MTSDLFVIERRAALASLAGCLVTPLAAMPAYAAPNAYRIGVLGAGSALQYAERMAWFRQELESLGWVKERRLTFEERWADGHYERLPELAGQLVALRVSLIFVTGGTPAVDAALHATRQIPIVFSAVGDPVGQNMVTAMGKPGANATGSSIVAGELYAKRLQFLKEAVPRIGRVALLQNGANDFSAEALQWSRSAGASMGVDLIAFDTRDFKDTASAFKAMVQARVEAVLIGSDPVLNDDIQELGALALKHQLPLTTTTLKKTLGVLLAYYIDGEHLYRRAAGYVDKILRGAKPGDLPIEQPTKFRLLINLKTASALDLTIPQSLLLRADEIVR